MDSQAHTPPHQETSGRETDQPAVHSGFLLPVKSVIIFLILFISCLLGLLLLTYGHGWGDDFAGYLLQAQAIADGAIDQFIARNTFTIENSIPGLGPIVYPWGYPLAVAPISALSGMNLIAIKLLNLVFYILFLAVAFFLFRNRLTFLETCLFVITFAVHSSLLSSINNIGSDVLFLFLTTLTMLLIDRWIVNGVPSLNLIKGFLIGLTVFATIQTRTIGVLFIPVLLVSQLVEITKLRREQNFSWKKTLETHALPYLTMIVLWVFFTRLFPAGGEGYLGQLSLHNTPRLFYRNFLFYTQEILPSFLNALPYYRIIFYLMLPISIIGALVNLKKDYAFVLYTFNTAVVYLLWPYTQGLRFIYPLLPFWIYFIFRGVEWIIHSLAGVTLRRVTRVVVTVLSLLTIAFLLLDTFQSIESKIENNRQVSGPFDANNTALFKFITENAPAGSIVSFFKPRAMRLLTGRDSFTLTKCEQLALADYYVAHKYKKLEPQGQITPDELGNCLVEGFNLELLFDLPKFAVYKIHKIP